VDRLCEIFADRPCEFTEDDFCEEFRAYRRKPVARRKPV
jgi:hypothetical protein